MHLSLTLCHPCLVIKYGLCLRLRRSAVSDIAACACMMLLHGECCVLSAFILAQAFCMALLAKKSPRLIGIQM